MSDEKIDAMPFCPQCWARKPYCQHFAEPVQPEGDAAPSTDARWEEPFAAPAQSPAQPAPRKALKEQVEARYLWCKDQLNKPCAGIATLEAELKTLNGILADKRTEMAINREDHARLKAELAAAKGEMDAIITTLMQWGVYDAKNDRGHAAEIVDQQCNLAEISEARQSDLAHAMRCQKRAEDERYALQAEVERLKGALRDIAPYFRSGNGVPVDRATIPRSVMEPLLALLGE